MRDYGQRRFFGKFGARDGGNLEFGDPVRRMTRGLCIAFFFGFCQFFFGSCGRRGFVAFSFGRCVAVPRKDTFDAKRFRSLRLGRDDSKRKTRA